MIEELMVRDYILFDQARVAFDPDMAVITGETGAGKSLLIDAIHYISGARVSSSVVRKGASQAVLSMTLSAPEGEAAKLLEENGYDAEDELIITRIVSDKGKSKMRVNDQPASLAFVRELTSKMIDIHSQMDTVQLMDPAVQLNLLDQYAGTLSLREEVAGAYKEYARISRELREAQTETFSDEELEFVTNQFNEIEEAAIGENELQELQENIEEASKVQKNLEDFSELNYLLTKDGGVLDSLYEAFRLARNNDKLQKQAEELNTDYYSLQAMAEEVSSLKDDVIAAAGNLDQMQEREYQIRKLFRRYGGSYTTMQEKKAQLEARIDRIIHRQDLFDRLEAEKKQASQAYLKLAQELSKRRQAVFDDLASQIQAHARDMMLEHAIFKIERKEKPLSPDGIDAIEFMASMNPGQPLTTLKTSASGGELSRLMLALKVVFQAAQGIGTIVFDEIDTGVSGRVALAMGSKMHKLAENYQVLCITHLASVAVCADSHFRVAKESDGTNTTTTVKRLSEQEDLEELATMAYGSANASTMQSMKELRESVHG